MSLTSEQLAYWAGAVDGEGSIAAYRSRSTTSLAPRLTLYNTNRGFIEAACHELGMNQVLVKKQSPHKPVFVATVTGRKPQEICRQLLPYLRIKRLHAFVIQLWNLLPPPRGGIRIKGERSLTRQELSMRHTAAELLKRWNHRGVR